MKNNPVRHLPIVRKLLRLFAALHRSLPDFTAFPHEGGRPGMKLFLHGTIVTIPSSRPAPPKTLRTAQQNLADTATTPQKGEVHSPLDTPSIP